MIVLLMSDSKLNEAALSKLRQMHEVRQSFVYPHTENAEPDEELTIVDLDANNIFQNTISKEELGEFLMKNKLVSNETPLNLLVSDVADGNSIAVYAAALAHTLQAQHDISLEVRFVEDLNYDKVFISPPTTPDETWKVFGLNSNNNIRNYINFFSNDQKERIWEGDDIIQWCIQENNIVKQVRQLTDDLNIGDAYLSGF